MKDLSSIVAKFNTQGTITEIKPLGAGLINDTYKVNTQEADAPDYVLQRINHAIFQNVEMLQSNIAAVTGFDTSQYFSLVFKKMTGVSPSTYRKTHLYTKD